MVDVLDLQVADDDLPQAPDEEKGSAFSVTLCHQSRVSLFHCWLGR